MIFHLQIFKSTDKQSGFTLMELLMVIAIIGVLTVMSLTPITNSINENRFQDTVNRLETIRNAILGDASIVANGNRINFGFLGDIGALPSAAQGINILVTNSGLAAWALNTGVKFGYGWNGPYLTSAQAGVNFTVDGWGRAITYNAATNPPNLTSLGADGLAGGTGYNSDIVVTLPTNLTQSLVNGFITASGQAYTGLATVEINYPNGSGALTTGTLNINAGAKGFFSFANIPLGIRSVKVSIPNNTAPTQVLGPSVINIDSGNYLIPNGVFDTGGTTTASTCNGFGALTLVNGSISLTTGNRTLNFRFNAATNVILQKVATSSTVSTTFNSVTVAGTAITCNGANQLYPCPASNNGTVSGVTPNLSVTSGNNKTVAIGFANSLSGSGTMTVQFYHNLGCEQFNITGL